MDGIRGYYAEWNNLEKNKEIKICHLYVGFKDKQQSSNKAMGSTTRKLIHTLRKIKLEKGL